MFKQRHGIKYQLFTAQISLVLISTISFFIFSSVYLYRQNINTAYNGILHTGDLCASQINRIFAQLDRLKRDVVHDVYAARIYVDHYVFAVKLICMYHLLVNSPVKKCSNMRYYQKSPALSKETDNLGFFAFRRIPAELCAGRVIICPPFRTAD